jgi:hypothetical protein
MKKSISLIVVVFFILISNLIAANDFNQTCSQGTSMVPEWTIPANSLFKYNDKVFKTIYSLSTCDDNGNFYRTIEISDIMFSEEIGGGT